MGFYTTDKSSEGHSRLKLLTNIPVHANAILDFCWLSPSSSASTSMTSASVNKEVVTGSGDTTLAVVNVETGTIVQRLRGGHTASVKSVDAQVGDSNLILSGGRDGTVCIWDRRATSGAGGGCKVLSVQDAHAPFQPSQQLPLKQRRRQSLSKVSSPT